jgi:CDP-paratose 2-epimerase
MIAAETGKQITVYGDGKQVRDVLHVDDLLNAYDLAIENIATCAGEVYNVGGGSSNVLSIWTEFGPILEQLHGKPIPVARSNWRPGDQKVFVADVRKAERELGWTPKVSAEEGVEKLFEWVRENRNLF